MTDGAQSTRRTRTALDDATQALRRAEQKAGGPDFLTTRQTCAIAIAAFLRARAEEASRTHPIVLPVEWMHEMAAKVERDAAHD